MKNCVCMKNEFDIKEKIQEQLELLLDCENKAVEFDPIQIRLNWLLKAYQLMEQKLPIPLRA